MKKFAAGLASAGKTDNHPARAGAKVGLRRWLLDEIGECQARVFDAYAGSGAMHRAVWHRAGHYRGCDQRGFAGDRTCFVADNRRVLRAIDLATFTIFDLDAYGSPWPQMTIIAARRKLQPGEAVGFALTDGSPMRARLGAIEASLAALAGVEVHQAGASLRWRELTLRALVEVAKRMGGRLVEFRCAETGSRPILYSAAVLEGLSGGSSSSAA